MFGYMVFLSVSLFSIYEYTWPFNQTDFIIKIIVFTFSLCTVETTYIVLINYAVQIKANMASIVIQNM